MFDEVGGYVEGEMNIPQSQNTAQIGQPDFNTLDEPIKETVVRFFYWKIKYFVSKRFLLQLRDLRAVGVKFAYVLFPTEKKTLLKECRCHFIFAVDPSFIIFVLGDLWGPLLLCIFMAM